MSLKRIIMVAAAPVAIVAFASPAAAQGIPVFDTSTYVQALAQVQNTVVPLTITFLLLRYTDVRRRAA